MCTSLWLFHAYQPFKRTSTLNADEASMNWLSITVTKDYKGIINLKMDNTWATPVCASVKRNALFEVKLTVIWTLNNYNSYQQDSIRALALHSHWYNLYYSLSWFKMTWDNCSNTHQFEIAKFMNSNYNQPWLWLWWLLYLNLYPFFISSY